VEINYFQKLIKDLQRRKAIGKKEIVKQALNYYQ